MTNRAREPRHGLLHRTRPFHVPGLPGAYPLTLYLPPDYHHGMKHYPVAYMFDGQNLFTDHGSYSGGWHLHQVLDVRATRRKQVPLVVGIHHGGRSRIDELSPWPWRGRGRGKGEALLDWIVGPLAEMVGRELRVLHGPDNTLIGGSSMGGLLALYGIFRHPQFFGRALSMSPSLWLKRGEIFNFVAESDPPSEPRVYLDCGGREAGGWAIRHATWMAELLANKGLEPDRQLMWRPDSRGSHNEHNWRRRLPKALRFLYG